MNLLVQGSTGYDSNAPSYSPTWCALEEPVDCGVKEDQTGNNSAINQGGCLWVFASPNEAKKVWKQNRMTKNGVTETPHLAEVRRLMAEGKVKREVYDKIVHTHVECEKRSHFSITNHRLFVSRSAASKRNSIPISHIIAVREAQDRNAAPFSFDVETDFKTWTFSTSNDNERNQWLSLLFTYIDRLGTSPAFSTVEDTSHDTPTTSTPSHLGHSFNNQQLQSIHEKFFPLSDESMSITARNSFSADQRTSSVQHLVKQRASLPDMDINLEELQKEFGDGGGDATDSCSQVDNGWLAHFLVEQRGLQRLFTTILGTKPSPVAKGSELRSSGSPSSVSKGEENNAAPLPPPPPRRKSSASTNLAVPPPPVRRNSMENLTERKKDRSRAFQVLCQIRNSKLATAILCSKKAEKAIQEVARCILLQCRDLDEETLSYSLHILCGMLAKISLSDADDGMSNVHFVVSILESCHPGISDARHLLGFLLQVAHTRFIQALTPELVQIEHMEALASLLELVNTLACIPSEWKDRYCRYASSAILFIAI